MGVIEVIMASISTKYFTLKDYWPGEFIPVRPPVEFLEARVKRAISSNQAHIELSGRTKPHEMIKDPTLNDLVEECKVAWEGLK